MSGTRKGSALEANWHDSHFPETNSNTLVAVVAVAIEVEVAHRGKRAGHTSDTQGTHMGRLPWDMNTHGVLAHAEDMTQEHRNTLTPRKGPGSSTEWRVLEGSTYSKILPRAWQGHCGLEKAEKAEC